MGAEQPAPINHWAQPGYRMAIDELSSPPDLALGPRRHRGQS